MDDTLKDVGLAILGLALFTGVARHRVEHAGVRAIRDVSQGGSLHASVRSEGPVGLVFGQAARVRLTGDGVSLQGLPFRAAARPGVWASARHLEIDLTNVTLRGLPIRRLYADIPHVRFDGWDALVNERVAVRRAGEGPARAEVGEEGLRAFAARKYPSIRDVRVRLAPGSVQVGGLASLFGVSMDLEAEGTLAVSEGRYVNVSPTAGRMNGRPMEPATLASIARLLNPVLDVDADLGLGKWLTLTDVAVGEGMVTLSGTMRVPPRDTDQQSHARSK